VAQGYEPGRPFVPSRRAALLLGLLAGLPRAWGGSGRMKREVGLHVGEALARYGFPVGHPLGVDRQAAFLREAKAQGLDQAVELRAPQLATPGQIERFHTPAYVERVREAQRNGVEYLDQGDTPVFPGIFEASAAVVGSALDALARIMRAEQRASFQPIGGLHHARRDAAAGFCVFNDIGVVIETLRSEYAIRRIGYVDIDVHHGDGVFYAFETDADLIFADIHQDYRSLYPGTGRAEERGIGAAEGSKLNINLPAGAGDREFLEVWPSVLAHLRSFAPQFLLFQCGADGLDGDPLAHLRYSHQVHAQTARSLRHLADHACAGRIMMFGGGGYNRSNLGRAWCAALRELL
jgi:acetoin utilization protein AcuC